jgi:copper(I)-binding protein
MNSTSTIFFVGLAFAVTVAHAGGAAGTVNASDVYVRAVAPGQSVGAAYMELSNRGPDDHALVAVMSSLSKVAELHTHLEEGGMMKMRRLESIALPAGQTVRLQPGGLHVMLIGLQRRVQPGQTVDLTLIYEDGTRTALEAPVRRVDVGHSGHSHH